MGGLFSKNEKKENIVIYGFEENNFITNMLLSHLAKSERQAVFDSWKKYGEENNYTLTYDFGSKFVKKDHRFHATTKLFNFQFYSTGGRSLMRPLMRKLTAGAKARIFYINTKPNSDSWFGIQWNWESQKHRIQSVLNPTQENLEWDGIKSLTSEEKALNKTPLLIFADNLNEEGSRTTSEVWDQFNVQNVDYDWHVQKINLFTGEGIDEGIEWLKKTLQKKNSTEGKSLGKECST